MTKTTTTTTTATATTITTTTSEITLIQITNNISILEKFMHAFNSRT
jgi:hypothetical protein